MYGVLRLSYAETSNAVNELPFEEGSISDRAAGTGTEPKGLERGEFYLVFRWGGGGGKFPKSGRSEICDERRKTTHSRPPVIVMYACQPSE
jgi:hypothetical protein